jgi:hypothetical protein
MVEAALGRKPPKVYSEPGVQYWYEFLAPRPALWSGDDGLSSDGDAWKAFKLTVSTQATLTVRKLQAFLEAFQRFCSR